MPRVISAVVALCVVAGELSWAAEDSLAGHWRFDHAGPQVPDRSGNGHTAVLTGGRVVSENGRAFLRLDGMTRVEVPAAPELNLRRGFTVEARLRPTDLSDGRGILFKKDEYLLRVDWPKESSRLSFFVNVGEGWESRVSAFKLPLDTWYHVVASWDGVQLLLWVNGLPYAVARRGDPPPATANPLVIGTADGFAPGFVGDLEYVKLYTRVLPSSAVIQAAYAAGGTSSLPPVAVTSFDFRQGDQGWQAREGARMALSRAGLVMVTAMPGSVVMHDHLDADLEQRDFLALRLAVSGGSVGDVVFVTSRGAGRVRFATRADGQMHTYVLEPWQDTSWGGRLLALGLAPAEVADAQATVEYVRLTAEPAGEGEVSVLSLCPDTTLPRAQRAETVVARLRNSGGPAGAMAVRLQAPPGVELLAAATQGLDRLGYREERQLTWPVRAAAPLTGEFRVEVSGAGLADAALAASVTFLPGLSLPKADYVPEPVPVGTGKYRVWTHYCPLWKQGTHSGWKAIEPYPERQACRARGLAGLYIVGCMGGANREALERMAREGWDASSAYGNGWSYPAKLTQVGDIGSGPCADFVRQQEALWQAKTTMNVLPDITAAMMGWDARPWNSSPFFWADNTAATFRDLCRRAKTAMGAKAAAGPDGNTVIFCCWNEFGEGHYIEPTRGYGFSYLDAIRLE